jgi:hypothetical protein
MYNAKEDMKQIEQLLKAGVKKGLPDYRIKINLAVVRIINVLVLSTLLLLLIYLLN